MKKYIKNVRDRRYIKSNQAKCIDMGPLSRDYAFNVAA